MPDMAKILRLVEEGALTADEADEILSTLAGETPRATAGTTAAPASGAMDDTTSDPDRAGHLRVEITERGRRVVNLRVPVSVASFAAGFVPGLPDEASERIRTSIRAGLRGPIVDIATDDGDRVLIVNE
jgi:hypothetical protein